MRATAWHPAAIPDARRKSLLSGRNRNARRNPCAACDVRCSLLAAACWPRCSAHVAVAGAGLADANGQVHPDARPRQRHRHRRPASGRPPDQEMGPAGRHREPARRRRHRRHQRLRQRQGRPHPAAVADLVVHRASVDAREPAVQARGPRADRAGLQHRHRHFRAEGVAGQFARRTGGAGEGQARRAQLGRHHRRARFQFRRLAQGRRPRHEEGAVPQSGRSRQRPRDQPRAGLRVGGCDRAAAASGRQHQAARRGQHRPRAGLSRTFRPWRRPASRR